MTYRTLTVMSPNSGVRGRVAEAIEDAQYASESLSQLCALVLMPERGALLYYVGWVGDEVWAIARSELQDVIIGVLSRKAASIPGMQQMGAVISSLILAEDSYGSPLLHNLVSMRLYPLVAEVVTTFHSVLTTECLNALDAQGRTAFALAVSEGSNGSNEACRIAWLLLQAGADPNIRYSMPDPAATGGLLPTAMDTHKVLLQAWSTEQGTGALQGIPERSVDHLGGAGIHGSGYFNVFDPHLGETTTNSLPWYIAGGNVYLKTGWRKLVDVHGEEQDSTPASGSTGFRQALPPTESKKTGKLCDVLSFESSCTSVYLEGSQPRLQHSPGCSVTACLRMQQNHGCGQWGHLLRALQ